MAPFGGTTLTVSGQDDSTGGRGARGPSPKIATASHTVPSDDRRIVDVQLRRLRVECAQRLGLPLHQQARLFAGVFARRFGVLLHLQRRGVWVREGLTTT